MRKRLGIFLIIAMCAMFFAGCQDTPADVAPPSVDIEEVIPEPELPDIEDTFLMNKTAWNESEVLYEVSLEAFESMEQPELYRMGNDLLFAYAQWDEENQKSVYNLDLVGLEAGEVLCQGNMSPPMYGVVQILEQGLAVNDLGDGKTYLFDEELNQVGESMLPGGNFALNPTGDTGYQFTYKEGILETDLATGESQTFKDHVYDSFLQKTSGETVIYTYVDAETLMRGFGILDLKTGEVTTYESDYYYLNLDVFGNTWLGQAETPDDECLYVIGSESGQKQFHMNRNATVRMNGHSGQIIVSEMTEDGITVLSAYDRDGNLLSTCQAEGLENWNWNDFVWYEAYQGYVFTMSDLAGESHLMFWDVSTDMEGEGLLIEDMTADESVPAGTAVAQEYYDRAKEISETFGVKILIADQCETEISDHTCTLLLKEHDIGVALDTIEHVLSQYPDGFIQQLNHNTYQEIEMQVLGLLERDVDENGFSFISGAFVTHEYPGKVVMALDGREVVEGEAINSFLAQTMYHEFSHIIDKRLAFDSMFRDDAAYTDEGWVALNPEEFEYYDSYYGTLESQYEDYFIDYYACSNATEDRARTMEHAMAGYTYSFVYKNGLIEKLEYYCNGIRDSFDTTGWPEVLPWEETLNAVR